MILKSFRLGRNNKDFCIEMFLAGPKQQTKHILQIIQTIKSTSVFFSDH